jgi:hypothetical protein
VNGQTLGTMGPYVPYEFEITAAAKEGANEIQVEIADLVAVRRRHREGGDCDWESSRI